MSTPIIHRTWLSLTIGLDQEAAKVRNKPVYLLHFLLPPQWHPLIQRICCIEVAQCLRRSEIDREIHLDAIRTQHISNLRRLLQHVRRQGNRLGIHIVEHCTIDAILLVDASILLITGFQRLGHRTLASRNLFPFPNGTASKSTLNSTIRVVPMIQQTQFKRLSPRN